MNMTTRLTLILLAALVPTPSLFAAKAETYARVYDDGVATAGARYRAHWGVAKIMTRSGSHPVAEAIAVGWDRDGSRALSYSYAGDVPGRLLDEDPLPLDAKNFGQGLHCFWSGDYAGAIQRLVLVHRQAPENPACLYFLALSLARAGNHEEAERALAAAIDREIAQPTPNLAKLLERVQGSDRVWLENARSQASLGHYATTLQFESGR